jgi:pimeloyl-ACP methyl ester carboxylesterase
MRRLVWRHVAPLLAARDFHVLAPDNRGNGRSDRDPAGGPPPPAAGLRRRTAADVVPCAWLCL